MVTAAQRPLESLAAVAAPELLTTSRKPTVLKSTRQPPCRCAEPIFEAIEREASTFATKARSPPACRWWSRCSCRSRASATARRRPRCARSRKAAQIERFRTPAGRTCRQRVRSRPMRTARRHRRPAHAHVPRGAGHVGARRHQRAVCARGPARARYSSLSIKQVAESSASTTRPTSAASSRSRSGRAAHRVSRKMAQRQLAAAEDRLADASGRSETPPSPARPRAWRSRGRRSGAAGSRPAGARHARTR